MCYMLFWVALSSKLLEFCRLVVTGRVKPINPLGVRLGVEVSLTRTSPKLCLDYIRNQVLYFLTVLKFGDPSFLSFLPFFEWTSLSEVSLWTNVFPPPHFLNFFRGIGLADFSSFWLAWRSFPRATWCMPPLLHSPYRVAPAWPSWQPSPIPSCLSLFLWMAWQQSWRIQLQLLTGRLAWVMVKKNHYCSNPLLHNSLEGFNFSF